MDQSKLKKKKEKLVKGGGLKEPLITTALILALLGVVALLYFTGLRYNAERNHAQAIRAFNRNDVEQAQLLERRAVNLAGFEDRYHRALSRIYLSRISEVMNNEELNQTQKSNRLQGMINAMEQQAQRAKQISPHNVANHSNLGSIYRDLMSYGVQDAGERAVKAYQRAIELAPTNPSLYFQLGRTYIIKANLVSRGQKETVQQDLDEAGKHLEKALKLNSTFANARYFLGLVYAQQGKKQQAIKQFEKIASLNKRNKQQVQPILENLRAGEPALGGAGTPEEMPDLEEGNGTSSAATSTKQNE